MAYHTNFFNKDKSHRKDLDTRLNLILENIDEANSLLDIGTSGGYYSFGLFEKFKHITAMDNEKKLIDECIEIQKKNNVTKIDFRNLSVNELLKKGNFWDCILYMSVHHHVILQYGNGEAGYILKELSQRCNVMFFDMGQKNENCKAHNWWKALPDNDSQEEWLMDYLKSNTTFNSIKLIGSSKVHGVDRLLWKLENI